MIEEFFNNYPDIFKIEWNSELLIYYKDNPTEAICINEFILNSRTRKDLEKLENWLINNNISFLTLIRKIK